MKPLLRRSKSLGMVSEKTLSKHLSIIVFAGQEFCSNVGQSLSAPTYVSKYKRVLVSSIDGLQWRIVASPA